MYRLLVSILTISWIFLSPATASKGNPDASDDDQEEYKAADGVLRSYLNMGLLVIPVVKGDQVVAYARLKTQIATVDGSTIDPYHRYKHILLDAYFSDLYHALCDHWLDNGKDPTQESLQKRLAKITDKIIGPNKLNTYILNFYFYRPEKKKTA